MIQRFAAPAPEPDRDHGFKSHPRHLFPFHAACCPYARGILINLVNNFVYENVIRRGSAADDADAGGKSPSGV
jgi:hypothetical protein